MPEPTITTNPANPTHVAVPAATFQTVMKLLDQLPHGQVRGLFDQLAASPAIGISTAPDSEE